MSLIRKFSRMLVPAGPRCYLSEKLLHALQPRRFHAFGVGMPKSGTHSLTEMLQANYRAIHEVDADALIELLFEVWSQRAPQSRLVRYVRRKDRHYRAEMDSAHLNVFLLPVLLSEFPSARFILTIRDCYSWLNSFVDHQLSNPYTDAWVRLRDRRFGAERFSHGVQESSLKEQGLYTVDGYLSYWTWHNQMVLETIPPERLLIVRTHEIGKQTDAIAAFLGIEPETITRRNSHGFKARARHGIIAGLDKAFVVAKAREHCSELMDRFFPTLEPTLWD